MYDNQPSERRRQEERSENGSRLFLDSETRGGVKIEGKEKGLKNKKHKDGEEEVTQYDLARIKSFYESEELRNLLHDDFCSTMVPRDLYLSEPHWLQCFLPAFDTSPQSAYERRTYDWEIWAACVADRFPNELTDRRMSTYINETRSERTVEWPFTYPITPAWFAEFREKVRPFKLSINEQLATAEYRRIDERLSNLLYARTPLLAELSSSIWEQLWCENEFGDSNILERLVWAAIGHVTEIENCEVVKAVEHRRDFKHKSLERITTKDRNSIEVKSVLDRNRKLFSTFGLAINSRKSLDQDLQPIFKKPAIPAHRTRPSIIAEGFPRPEKSHSATTKGKHPTQRYSCERNDRPHLQSSSKKRVYDETLDSSLGQASFAVTSSSTSIEAASPFSSA